MWRRETCSEACVQEEGLSGVVVETGSAGHAAPLGILA